MRIGSYAILFSATGDANPVGAGQWPLIVSGVLAGFTGVLIGTRFLHKITMRTVQNITGILLLGIAVALGAGILRCQTHMANGQVAAAGILQPA